VSPLPAGEVSTREKRVVRVAPTAGPRSRGRPRQPARARQGLSHAGGVRTLLWIGRAQADGGGLRPGDAPGWHRAARGADVRDDDRRLTGPLRRVGRAGDWGPGDGVDRGVHAPHNVAKALAEWEYGVTVLSSDSSDLRTRLGDQHQAPPRRSGLVPPAAPSPDLGASHVQDVPSLSAESGGDGRV
jgi:hypothetical protein